MKAGDKVYYFDADSQEIVEGECDWAGKFDGRVYVRIATKAPNGRVIYSVRKLDHDCFASREELCEHYRKIFE